jgi:DNA-binding MarR family transcriptional regulator
MTRVLARDTARKLLEIMPLVMRTVVSELRAAGELPAPAHFPLLHVLSERPRTLSELAALRGVSLPSMSNSVATLVEHGWVRRAEAGRDRRVSMLEVTAGGKAALDRVTRSAERHLADALVGLDSPSARRLQAGLGVLREVFAQPPASQAERRRNGRPRP